MIGDGCDDANEWPLNVPFLVTGQLARLADDHPVMSEHDSRVQDEYRRQNLEWFNSRKEIMKATARTCTAVNKYPASGLYPGTWSGYVVRFHADDVMYEAKLDNGIRGEARCAVTVEGQSITVETP